MMKFIRDFTRQLRNGFRNLFRSGWMTTAATLTMTLTLFMMGFLTLFMVNIGQITTDIENGVRIRVHIDIAATADEEKKLGDQIRQVNHVIGLTYRTKDEELADIVANYGSEFQIHEGDENPLYNVYVVDVDDPANIKAIAKEIDQFPFTVQVTYGAIDTENLLRMMEMGRIILALVAAILVVIAIVLVSNTIKMTINARRSEIEIMRLVGGKNSYIRGPFAFEGMFIGLFSGILATGVLYAMYEGIQVASISILGISIIKFVPTLPMMIYIGIGMLVVGMILGIYGAKRSIKQYLTY